MSHVLSVWTLKTLLFCNCQFLTEITVCGPFPNRISKRFFTLCWKIFRFLHSTSLQITILFSPILPIKLLGYLFCLFFISIHYSLTSDLIIPQKQPLLRSCLTLYQDLPSNWIQEATFNFCLIWLYQRNLTILFFFTGTFFLIHIIRDFFGFLH